MRQLVMLKSVGGDWTDLGGSFSLWNNWERASHGVATLFNIHQGVVIKYDKNTMTEGCHLVKKLKIRYTNELIFIVRFVI